MTMELETWEGAFPCDLCTQDNCRDCWLSCLEHYRNPSKVCGNESCIMHCDHGCALCMDYKCKASDYYKYF